MRTLPLCLLAALVLGLAAPATADPSATGPALPTSALEDAARAPRVFGAARTATLQAWSTVNLRAEPGNHHVRFRSVSAAASLFVTDRLSVSLSGSFIRREFVSDGALTGRHWSVGGGFGVGRVCSISRLASLWPRVSVHVGTERDRGAGAGAEPSERKWDYGLAFHAPVVLHPTRLFFVEGGPMINVSFERERSSKARSVSLYPFFGAGLWL
jgi:hypothetical protein